ncbi:demethylmenaquinone methyltransferase / 2-methoxy-6-polyprenyl-1,4-benzoquinol methylase [Candidatus Hakubella thermalkaliphila]|uniref:Demethylmenaquinone methyltransferase n=1 Tax=Candidatus Hakubella thermalkaliphila TaxID=2754717 RepID=A0A6V8NTI0_9ACTN|nr:demethylmenaquinone methyltransferase / 2-methoxy-6-polyprenyl-1,4-benzoquinol methylase [Candidatus Hakubella thermalkaliphila]
MSEAQIEEMFSSIATKYDLLNDILSLGLHRRWKNLAAQEAGLSRGDRALDLCTGTGDVALALASRVGPEGQVVAVDLSSPMIEYARKKSSDQEFKSIINFRIGNACDLEFCDDFFDAVTIAFGARNVRNLERLFGEAFRVLKPRGRMVCLEFSPPRLTFLGHLYGIYLRHLVPFLGVLLARHREAYSYLATSICSFPEPGALVEIMNKAGFGRVTYHRLNLGVVTLHVGIKDTC